MNFPAWQTDLAHLVKQANVHSYDLTWFIIQCGVGTVRTYVGLPGVHGNLVV